MLNRETAPLFREIKTINFIRPEERRLLNAIPLYLFQAAGQSIVRIEFIFENVNWDASQPLAAVACSNLFNSGTRKLSAKEIADKIDYYGAFLQSEYSADQLTITLYSLQKHLPAVLPILKEMLADSNYPESELAIYVQNHKQKLLVNLQKMDFIARKLFAHALFGDTPYGSDIQPEDYDRLNRESLLSYFNSAIRPENCTIIAAGNLTAGDIQLIDDLFGGDWAKPLNEATDVNMFSFEEKGGMKFHHEKAGALQNAIRMGCLSLRRAHPDFPALQVLNTVLGGYFGSRLMANIRENKGYTYGIGSGLASLKHAGYFFISTEVGSEVCTDALKEIYHEINLLRTEKISDGELSLVRNYMLGSLLGSLENIFSHADKFKNLLFSGLDYDYYVRYIETVRYVDAAKLLQMAQTYLIAETFTEVVAGK